MAEGPAGPGAVGGSSGADADAGGRGRRWSLLRRGLGKWLLAVYAVLLLASQAVQWVWPPAGEAPASLHVEVPVVSRAVPGGEVTFDRGRRVRVGYNDSDPPREGEGDDRGGPPSTRPTTRPTTRPVLLLLHGSPGSAGNFDELTARLRDTYRVVTPDLPGFGGSSAWVPDYSITAHAGYVLELMNALKLPSVHVLGFSMGSGVAMELERMAPGRVKSLTIYGGIGVQEGEGSGDYYFEHLKYGAGYVALVAVPELLPHFGLLGPRELRHAFIRNFWDTDQRPLRGMLQRLKTPLLILHGAGDPLVPAWVAEEHHRIVPGSEYVLFAQSHFMLFSPEGAALLAGEVRGFVGREEARRQVTDTATTDLPATRPGRTVRYAPEPERPARIASPWTSAAIIALTTFASEDLTVIGTAQLIRIGQCDLFVGFAGCMIGIFGGDMLLWAIGRVFGRRALGWGWVRRRVGDQKLEEMGEMIDRHTGKVVLASRFIPGARLPTYLAAGALGKRRLTFAMWTFLAAGIWTPLLLLGVVLLGDVVAGPIQKYLGKAGGIVASVVVALAMIRLLHLLSSPKGRRRLQGLVSRLLGRRKA